MDGDLAGCDRKYVAKLKLCNEKDIVNQMSLG